MKTIKLFGGILEQILESLKPAGHFLLTLAMGIFAHLDIIASLLAVVVLLFQFKVVFFNGKVKEMELKLKRMEYNKECKED